MNRKPKVLIIDNSRGVTGALVSVIRSSTYLKDVFDFEFLLPNGSKAAAHVRQLGFKTHELPMQELRRSLFSALAYVPVLLFNLWRFFGLQRKIRADVLHSNDAYNLLAPLYRMFGGKTSYICHFRFMPSRFPGAYLRFVLALHRRYASQLIVVSGAVVKELPLTIKSTVVYDGLPLEPITFKEPFNKLLLYPASYTRGKGQDFALKSFAMITGEFPGWKLRFVGSDFGLAKNQHYRRELEMHSKSLDLDEKVEWSGEATRMMEEYSNASVVLNFSLSESFSLTCQEAQYCGRPVIATKSGGPAEIVVHEETGWLVEVGDVDEMSKAMRALMSNPPRRAQMGQFGMRQMRERFAPEKTFERLKSVYQETLRHSP